MKTPTKIRTLLLGVLVTAGLVAGSLPASAGTTEWKDPEGDATGVGLVTTTPLPSDEGFDVTKVTLTSDGTTFRYTVGMKKLAATFPTLSTGYYFRLAFTYADVNYWFIVAEDRTGAKTFTFRPTDTTASAQPCARCTGVIDRKANAVVVTAPVASLAGALKAANKDAPALAKGSKLTKLFALSQRWTGSATLTADEAPAPEGVSFTI